MSINPALVDLQPLVGVGGWSCPTRPFCRILRPVIRDEREAGYSVLYADDRGVSRIYRMSLEGARWRIWRDTPEFSQRFEAQVDSDAAAIRGRWEKSTDQGTTWEHDFNVDYLRDQAREPDSPTGSTPTIG